MRKVLRQILLRLDEATTDDITDQAGCLMNVQFLHDPGSVGLCGLHADPQDDGHLLGRLALGNELENLPQVDMSVIEFVRL